MMEEQLRLLVELQEIDAKIREWKEEKGRAPEQLADFDQRGLACKNDLEKVSEALQAAQKNKRDRDRDLEEGGLKVEKLKTRSSEIKNNKEYQAQLKEIAAVEQENKAIEDDILVLMEKIDAATAELAAAEKRLKEETAAIEVERKEFEARGAKLDEELSVLERSRAEAAARIDSLILGRYQVLAGSKPGKVVVEARGESCSGCYMSIPPQVYVNVKKNNTFITCPNCHRILYYKG